MSQAAAARSASTDKPARRGNRLSSDDWARAALELIAEQGVNALAVEPLARRLGVTKGSFYWHYPTRDALLQAALEHWQREELDALDRMLNASIEGMPDARERLRALIKLVSFEANVHAVYSQLLKAMDHPIVAPIIENASLRRIAYLDRAFRQAGLSPADAGLRARLAYSAYIGFMQLNVLMRNTRLEREQFEAYVEHVIGTLVPG